MPVRARLICSLLMALAAAQACDDDRPPRFRDDDDGATGLSSGTGASGGTRGKGSSEDGPSTTEGAGAGAPIYCDTGENYCLCRRDEAIGSPDTECGPSTIDGSARCCGDPRWPGGGACSCWKVGCTQDASDFCYCGELGVDATDQGSCDVSEGVCCYDPEDGTCACNAGLVECLPGEQEMSNCDSSRITCNEGESEVELCH
jgi:hypothetical protein